jgi:hypothetical protein
MPHVTFVHGLSNKPEAKRLHGIWLRALAAGGGLDLPGEGVTTSMCYWADVLYEKPDDAEEAAAFENAHGEEAALAHADGEDVAATEGIASAEEALFVDGLRHHFTSASLAEIEAGIEPPSLGPDAVALERVPLPWFIKKRIMKAFLRDAHHYYFNKDSTPRPGETYKVQDEIRRRFLACIGTPPSRPHVVVAHSMGTMIAYDCLRRVGDCAGVDHLMTLGSPLGIDEVQDCNKPEWSRADGFPSLKLPGRWVNVFDPLDVVCAADPRLSSDFRHGGRERVEDIGVGNDGAWRHSIVKYLAQPRVRELLKSMLAL